MEWLPHKFEQKIPHLWGRAQVMRNIRDYFEGLEYLEVDTPALQKSPGMEVHVHAFKTELLSADQQTSQSMYLNTSPEFAMKKLLVAGLPKIFQMCKCFRNAEQSPLHSPEFTMLEWYHVGINYEDLMEETIGLLCHVTDGVFQWGDLTSDPHQVWQKISVCEAFEKYADINLEEVLEDVSAFEISAGRAGCPAHEGDTWDDLFFRVFLEKIEPNLGHPVPTILYDYPKCMSSLARLKDKDPRFAERFEIYVCGLELANAFGELSDADEQRLRFENAMAEKQSLYGETWPVEDDFLKALEYGMPACSGIALGVDRLAMLVTGADHIDQIQALKV